MRQWALETKYYTADLDVHVLPAGEWHAPGDAAAEALDGAEALIVLLDATERGSFAGAQAWADRAADAGVGTLLCVTNKVDVVTGAVPGAELDGDGEAETLSGAAAAAATASPAAGEHDVFVQRVTEWCLDAGFEHVQTAATAPHVGGAGRDKGGVPRVLEALQCTMWGSMRRRGGGGGGGGDSDAAAAAAAAEPESTGDDISSPSSAADAPAAAAPASTSDSAAAAAAAAPAERSPEDAVRQLLRGVAGADGDADGGGDDDDSAVERLMADMQRVRDAARGPGMSDAQRREAAARMAMQLFALMGAGGDDDEDDDDGEGDGDEAEEGGGKA